jgi:hypothetical protein
LLQSRDGEVHAKFILGRCNAQDLFVHLCRTSESDEVLANTAAILGCFAAGSAAASSATGTPAPARHPSSASSVEQEIESLLQ